MVFTSCRKTEPFPNLHINKDYFKLNSVRFDQEQPMEEDPSDVRHISEPLNQLFHVPNSMNSDDPFMS